MATWSVDDDDDENYRGLLGYYTVDTPQGPQLIASLRPPDESDTSSVPPNSASPNSQSTSDSSGPYSGGLLAALLKAGAGSYQNPFSPGDPSNSGGAPDNSAADSGSSNNAWLAQELPPLFLFEDPPVTIPPPLPEFPHDLTKPPGPGYIWKSRGGSPPGDSRGSWHNPETDEVIHPDFDHAPPIGPHMDYTAPDGRVWRWFPDGRMELSSES